MREKSSNIALNAGPSRQMLRRTLLLMAVCGIAACGVLIARLYKLQIVEHEFYQQLALEQQLRESNSSTGRGLIYDRNMYALALSASVDNVYLSPAEIDMYGEDRELIAKELSRILELDYDEVMEKSMQTGSWYVTLKRRVEEDTAAQVRAFKNQYGLRGVRLETDIKRYYPNSSLACHVIGFVGTDNYGLEGVEARYDEALAGTKGGSYRSTNAFGTDMLFSQFENYQPGESGYDLVLTIDSTIQYYVEKHLKQAVEDYDIQNGAGAIAMDVNTGEILAMASLGGYDLNDFLQISPEAQAEADAAGSPEQRAELIAHAQQRQWRNKALSDTYEPGSTFKIITLAMALEESRVSDRDSFYCPGSVNVTGRTSPIRCWKTTGHGSQTLTQAVQHSCNVAFVNIGQRVGAESFYKYCEAFGFLELTGNTQENLTAMTGIDLAGESGSIFWSEDTFYSQRNLSQLAAASFGQTFTITPLQLITAVSACVNGGQLMQPYVVKAMLNADGSVAAERQPLARRQVISEETSAQLRNMLEQVVGDDTEGTGRNAAVAGYRIGGKTGTSEKVSLEAQTGEKEYIVSFIGFAPADEPQIALLVFLDTPSNESGIYISGGQMAAPVVGKMLNDILPYMGVEPEYEADDIRNMDVTMPSVTGLELYEATERLHERGLSYRTIGSGETVTAQLPLPGLDIAAGTQVILYLGAQVSPELETVPELSGLSYSEARDILSRYGLYIQSSGAVSDADTQMVSTQSIQAGTLAEHGSVIQVSLVSGDDSILGKY